MESFTPLSAALGGFLIGAAAVAFMALKGRVAGISGIVAGVLLPVRGDWLWRVLFVLGLFAAPFAYWAATGAAPVVAFERSYWVVALGGLLVGFGARLGGGCTSGHGVCGVARLSRRSIAATLTFMITAIVTVYLFEHGIGG